MTELPQSVPTIVVCDCRVGTDGWAVSALAAEDIQVWRQRLDLERDEIEKLRSILSTDERARAARFRFDTVRHEFIVARGTLRMLLGSYLDKPPAKLRFEYSKYGRPRLATDTNSVALNFNVSHSGTVALLAFARGRRIGIDVERVRRDFATSEIAERFFSIAERAALLELPAEQRHQAFFRCWTRKEAFIKALGEGLSHPLDQFDVSLALGSPAALLATRPDSHEARRWSLWDVEVAGDYAAAVAAEMGLPPA